MKNIFSQVSAKRPGSNTFDLSCERKMSSGLGDLTPILVMETLPGDVINLKTSMMNRMPPLVAPVMHAVNVYSHFYFVPNRILWPNWEKFITGGEDGEDATVAPTVAIEGAAPVAVGSLLDYMGLPTGAYPTSNTVNALPIAAYARIYNEYYRDQNLIPKIVDELVDGNNGSINLTLQKRAWQHDYFTSCLPWTQRGPQATIPLGDTAPIIFDNQGAPAKAVNLVGAFPNFQNIIEADGEAVPSNTANLQADIGGGTRNNITIDNSASLLTDLSTATASSIIDLRRAFKLQEWLEKNARGGARYIESILSHFGVRSPDGRLQRPEFLGGGSTPIQISEVLQTSAAATEPTPQGNMAGHAIGVGQNNSFKYRCTEHGYIIGIMSVMPKTAYQQGIPRHYKKFDKFDYYWPSFAHIGEQAVINNELYVDGGTENEDVFGYVPRFAEYKYLPSTVHGEFRTTLDSWHWGRIFATRPQLNQAFVECVPDTRIFAVETGEKIYSYIHHNIKARRLMPYFGNPGF